MRNEKDIFGFMLACLNITFAKIEKLKFPKD